MTLERRAFVGIFIAVVLGCLLWLGIGLLFASSAQADIPDKYDADIREAAGRYLPGWDWRLLKAQYYQESKLDPSAVSSADARGIAQIVDPTWNRIAHEIGHGNVSPHAVGPAIEAGAYYMAKLRDEWSAPRPSADRYSLSAASYNAGLGNLLKAQRKCGGRNLYAEIIPCLPQVTGSHAQETRTYIERIWDYWRQMLIGG